MGERGWAARLLSWRWSVSVAISPGRQRGRVREKKQAGTSASRDAGEALGEALSAFAGVMEEEG
jgi:hypothetical protein